MTTRSTQTTTVIVFEVAGDGFYCSFTAIALAVAVAVSIAAVGVDVALQFC